MWYLRWCLALPLVLGLFFGSPTGLHSQGVWLSESELTALSETTAWLSNEVSTLRQRLGERLNEVENLSADLLTLKGQAESLSIQLGEAWTVANQYKTDSTETLRLLVESRTALDAYGRSSTEYAEGLARSRGLWRGLTFAAVAAAVIFGVVALAK